MRLLLGSLIGCTAAWYWWSWYRFDNIGIPYTACHKGCVGIEDTGIFNTDGIWDSGKNKKFQWTTPEQQTFTEELLPLCPYADRLMMLTFKHPVEIEVRTDINLHILNVEGSGNVVQIFQSGICSAMFFISKKCGFK